MNEQFPYRPDESSDAGRDRLPAPTDQFAPVQRFPPEQFPTERFPTEQFPTEQFPTRPSAGPVEPLAHEGGLPYGNSPAAPYRPYLPQHLMPQPFMPQPYPMQQTVVVAHGGGRRVNHVLHLILTILTFGLWLPLWAVLAIANS